MDIIEKISSSDFEITQNPISNPNLITNNNIIFWTENTNTDVLSQPNVPL